LGVRAELVPLCRTSFEDSRCNVESSAAQVGEVLQRLQELNEHVLRIEDALTTLTKERMKKDFYSTEEVGELLGKAPFTIREWCRLGRIKAQKRHSGRGAHPSWVITHEELLRIEREGLLPLPRPAR
jgi:hypothetical protein